MTAMWWRTAAGGVCVSSEFALGLEAASFVEEGTRGFVRGDRPTAALMGKDHGRLPEMGERLVFGVWQV